MVIFIQLVQYAKNLGDSYGLLEPSFKAKLFHFHEGFPKIISINYTIIRYNFQIEPPFSERS